jgi:cyclopropane-fatty-acyl-phospholipid synthase
MLDLYCQRAQLVDGQDILELGCGWGSLSLYLAQRYPSSRIVTVSNSSSQKEFIDGQIKALGLTNLTVITANIVDFSIAEKFDRIISIEMFEHLKNYEQMFERVSSWLKADGRLFIHIFTHRTCAYHYEDKNGDDWLTRTFFEGGTMPAEDLFLYFQKHLRIIDQWTVNGTHYGKTAEAWLAAMKANRAEVMQIMAATYGADMAVTKWSHWKVFFLACAELWNYKDGSEWTVSHYLFAPQNESQN